MSGLNFQDQQIDRLRFFWQRFGKYIIGLIFILIIGYIASSVNVWHKKSQAEDAAQAYANLNKALTDKDEKLISGYEKIFIDKFTKTQYAPMALMQLAKYNFDQKKYPETIRLLSWVKDNSVDKSLKTIAVLRLASVYVDQKQFDKALELLKTKHDLAFDALFYEARGDMYVAKSDLEKARDAYKQGLQKAANDPGAQQILQMKLDVIGE